MAGYPARSSLEELGGFASYVDRVGIGSDRVGMVDAFRESRHKESRQNNGNLEEALFDNILGWFAG